MSLSDLNVLKGKDVHELWRAHILATNGSYLDTKPWHDLADEVKEAWNHLSLQLAARHLADREFIRKMVRVGVQNHIANSLGITRDAIQQTIKSQVSDALRNWIHNYVDVNWLRSLISQVLQRELQTLVKGRFTVVVEPKITLTEKKE